MFSQKFFLKLAHILVIGMILSLGFLWLQPGLPIGHDSFAQITYSKVFFRSLSQGQFPVRFSEWVQNGYSQPLFNFYQVGFYYLVSLFMAIFPAVLSIKLTVLFLWWLGTGFVYLFAKKFGDLPALLACLVYAFSPYLALDVFIRSSYPEFMALSLLPGCLWSIDKIASKSKLIFVPLLSFMFGLSLISHLPATLIFSPVLLGYILLLILTKQTDIKGLALVGLGIILGISLSTFYLLPAIFELKLIKIETLTELGFNFHRHFADPKLIFSYIWGFNGLWWGSIFDRSVLIGLNQLWIILAGLATVSWALFKKKLQKNLFLIFFYAVLLYGLFFSFKSSLFLWENLKTLKFIQFPWRFLMVVPISVSLIAATSIYRLKRVQQLIVLFISLVTIFVFNLSFLQPQIFLPEDIFNASLNQWDKNPLTREQAFLEPSYMPAGINELPEWGIDRWEPKLGQAKVRPIEIKDIKMSFEVSAKEKSLLQINTHYFPGWQAYLNGERVEIDSSDRYKFMTISIPAGHKILSLKLEDTPIRKVANLVSLLSVILILFFLIHKLLQALFDWILAKLSKANKGYVKLKK